MGCYNCHTPGGEALYNLNSHGDIGATYNSMVNADLPSYAHGFYSPSEHEQISDIRYNKIEVGYDENLKEIQAAMAGPPLTAYIPRHIESQDNGSAVPAVREADIVIKNPQRTIVDEIMKAQAELKEIRIEEVEEIIIRRKRSVMLRKL
ncbi:MAG: hypothetical protein KJ601_05785 [Nanoarchaeota archaeon]|nr:hypothetical protein [Nanoarchaeota archaeon]MBU1704964.1 hypothetical protein [Nanoarchaeota archaeon]